jgi:enamine deaminase RidA (YjgF/YER057c/UK114 family)
MNRRLISTGSPFETSYGYSRAVVDGDYVFVAGTTGYDYATMTMPADPAEQARNIFKTIGKALIDAGSSLESIVRTQIFVTDIAYGIPVLEVCGEVLRDIRPASGIYAVSALLRPEMKVEIEVTARLS